MMSPLSLGIAWLDSWPILALQLHSLIPMGLIGTLWFMASYSRRKEFEESLERKGDAVSGCKAPLVSFILPTRGYRKCSLKSWRAILGLKYGGPVRVTFVVESPGDPCVPHIKELAQGARGDKQVEIIHSGSAKETSQKIHNLMHGIQHCVKENSTDGYIVCMDDDVEPHADFLCELVGNMENEPHIRVATAYPFDIPEVCNASLYSYATMAYHLPLSVGLAISTKTKFVWGGCMVFRWEDMTNDRLGILSSWSRGGYSDDLIVAARMGKLGLHIYCPGCAVFPQWISPRISFKEYWNYLRRQLFVLDTYSDWHNMCTNYGLACLFLYGSVGFVGPTVTIPLRLLALLWQKNSENETTDLPSLWIPSVTCFMIGLVYMSTALYAMILNTSKLLGELHGIDYKSQILTKISWMRLSLGFWLSFVISPVCLAYTLLTKHIVWSGITYTRNNGRVSVVAAKDPVADC